MLKMAGGLLGLPFYIISMLAEHRLTLGTPKDFNLLLSFARVAGLICIVAATGQLSSPQTRRKDYSERETRYSTSFVHMARDRKCAHSESDRVTNINDSMVITGRIT